MTIDNLMLTVHRVPEITLNTGTDWVAILGSMAAIIAVVVGSIYNASSFKKTIISQETIAKKNVAFQENRSRSEFLAKSRLEWIALIREQVAHFLSLGQSVHDLSKYVKDTSSVSGVDKDKAFDVPDESLKLRRTELYDKLAKARLHFAQLELLLSPNDMNSKKLVSAMSDYIQAACEYRGIVDKGQAVVSVTQEILRREWDKVSTMEVP